MRSPPHGPSRYFFLEGSLNVSVGLAQSLLLVVQVLCKDRRQTHPRHSEANQVGGWAPDIVLDVTGEKNHPVLAEIQAKVKAGMRVGGGVGGGVSKVGLGGGEVGEDGPSGCGSVQPVRVDHSRERIQLRGHCKEMLIAKGKCISKKCPQKRDSPAMYFCSERGKRRGLGWLGAARWPPVWGGSGLFLKQACVRGTAGFRSGSR